MTEAESMNGDGAREGEGEDDGNFQLNPFLQPPILKTLFEKLPVQDLARCRLVSKIWCSESIPTWRSKATHKFGKEEVATREDGSVCTTSVGEFLDIWEAGDWGSCPFRKFNLTSWSFKAGNVEQERFMGLVGPHITSLALAGCKFVRRENFRKIIYQAFPKLQFLKMNTCWVYDPQSVYLPSAEIVEYRQPAFGVHGLESLDLDSFSARFLSMMDMLSHFHKVKSLRLELGRSSGYQWNLLETIRLIRAQDPTKLPLKVFDVKYVHSWLENYDPDIVPFIERLRLHHQLNLPLQALEIHFGSQNGLDGDLNNQIVLRDIVQNNHSTLKQLEVSGRGPTGLIKPFPFGFYLKKLEELAFPCFADYNLNYLKYTPNLRVLKIYDEYSLSISESDQLFSNSSELGIEDWTLPALRDLRFEPTISICNLKKLMKWMPNVESLTVAELDDDKFSMVCKNWKNLKYLQDWGEELSDDGVIGSRNAHEGAGDEVTRSGKGLTIIALKKLTVFKTHSSKLSSASVHDGFLKMDNLKMIGLGESTKLDDEAKAALERHKIELVLER